MNFKKIQAFMILLLAPVSGFAGSADLRGDPSVTLDVKIELRVLDFIATPAGRNEVAVLFDHDNRQSLQEAQWVEQALNQAAPLAHNKVATRLLDADSLPVAGRLKAVILTKGLEARYSQIMDYGIAEHTLVLAAGADCARVRDCMVGVSTAPEVEIGVNPEALRRSGIRFADGFELMVKEY